MRTTVTLDPDVEALVEQAMRDRRLSFKAAINEAIRAGLGRAKPKRRSLPTRTFHMGFEPAIPWDKALRLAADLEDEELSRQLVARK